MTLDKVPPNCEGECYAYNAWDNRLEKLCRADGDCRSKEGAEGVNRPGGKEERKGFWRMSGDDACAGRLTTLLLQRKKRFPCPILWNVRNRISAVL